MSPSRSRPTLLLQKSKIAELIRELNPLSQEEKKSVNFRLNFVGKIEIDLVSIVP